MTETGPGADPRGSSPWETPSWESSLSDSSLSQPSADPPNPFSREGSQAGETHGAQPTSAPSAGAEPFDPYQPSATSDAYTPYAYPGPYPAPEPYPAPQPQPNAGPPPGFDPQPTPPYGIGATGALYGAPPPAYGSNPYEVAPYQPVYGGSSPYGLVPVNHPQAVSAMVFGILGIVLGFSCGVGGLIGIAGIVQGRKARDEIDAEPGRYTGRSQAVAGVVTGIIGLVVAALAIVVVVLLVVYAGTGEL